jgi:YD repeat-containing protein
MVSSLRRLLNFACKAPRAGLIVAFLFGCAPGAVLSQSRTVPARLIYYIYEGNPQELRTFSSGDAGCAYESRRLTLANWTSAFQTCGQTFTHTVTTTLVGAPYWTYGTNPSLPDYGPQCNYPIRSTDSLVTDGPNTCGYALGNPRSDITRVWQYPYVYAAHVCPLGDYIFSGATKTCTLPYSDPHPPALTPKCGNPVAMGSGCKIETVDLTSVPSGSRRISLSLRYASINGRGGGRLVGNESWFLDPLDRRLALPANPNLIGAKIVAIRPEGGFEEFTRTDIANWTSVNPRARLEVGGSFWWLTDFDEQTIEAYDSLGRLAVHSYFDGSGLAVTYESPSSVRPTQIQSSTGVTLSLTHNSSGVETIGLPGGRQIRIGYLPQSIPTLAYSEPYVSSVIFEDDTSRTFAYTAALVAPGVAVSARSLNDRLIFRAGGPPTGSEAHADHQFLLQGRVPLNLESVFDELDRRFARFEYDEKGRATLSEHAEGVNRYRFSHTTFRTDVTEPLGATRSFNFQTVNGRNLLSSVYRQAPGLPLLALQTHYDTFGNVSRTLRAQNPITNCMSSDPQIGREVARVEGLPYATTCPANLATYPPSANTIERKTLTEWHTNWRLPTRIAEPKKITTIVYTGSAVNCVPSTILVGGRTPAVACSRTEQATSDESGALGFNATPVGMPRTWSYTYTTFGRVLTAADPNNKTTVFSYYPADDPDVGKRGNIATIANAANHVTQITEYSPRGQPTRIVDPNGLVTVLDYNPRMRLTSRTVGNEATVFGYDPVGQMTSVNLPDGARLTYTYDAAHRLTAINDHKGNRIDYTLDAMGNRIGEQMKDPGGVLVSNIARVIDALNRVQQVTGSGQ